MDSETSRNKCAACYRQYNKMEHLVEHMRVSYHSAHEPKCGVCDKHCRSFESLREHLIGPLPKAECARIFSSRGCNLCLTIFDSSSSLRHHRASCQLSRAPGLISRMSRLGFHPDGSGAHVDLTASIRKGAAQVVALGCKMVGGGSDGSLDLCARVCLVDEDETVVFHSYVRPSLPVTNYRHETTGVRAEQLRDAAPVKQVQRKVLDFLCNGEALWKIRSAGGRARVLVGHGLDHDLDRLGIEYPSVLTRDTASYPPLMKTSKLSNSLKYLTQTYLGYDIQMGTQDPYEDCVATMRLYLRMRSQRHPGCGGGGGGWGEAQSRTNFASWKQRELEKMTPAQLLDISVPDYYCWCLDS